MARKNYFAVILAVIMAFSAVTACELAFTQSSIVAYAASMSAPSVKASNASYKSVKLKWKKVKGAKKYIVMRSAKKKSGYKTIATIKKNTYTDKKTSCGKTYYYKVVAVKGSTKKTSKTVKIKCTPAKVSRVKTSSASCGDVTITFKKVKGAKGYDIRYSSAKKGAYKSIAVIKATSYTQSIGVGNEGYYKVRAYRTVKGKKVYGPYSSVVSATAVSHSYSQWTDVSPATCTTQGIQAAVCSVCRDVQYQAVAGAHVYADTVAAPTCTSQGYTAHTCIYCGVSYQDSFIPATGSHSYGSYIVEKSPTCGEAGSKYTVCSVCGDKHYEVMAATGEHAYVTSAVNATCTQAGAITKTCKYCSKTLTTEIAAKGHSYTETVTAPSCTERGYVTHTCSACGDSYKDTYTNAFGHSFESYTNNNDATCIADATETAKCSRCDITDTRPVSGSMLTHKYEGKITSCNDGSHKVYCSYGCDNYEKKSCSYSYEIIQAATYTSAGTGKYTCIDCGYSYTVTIPAVDCDHSETEIVGAKAATCTEAGYTGNKTCKICGQIVEGGTVVIAKGHNYVTTEATCTEASHRECSGCGLVDTEYVIVPAFGHTASMNYSVETVAIDETTSETHLYDACSVCGENFETDTFCLDITGITAEKLTGLESIARLSATGNKLTLTVTKFVDKFEVSGTANDLTISMDAFDDGEIKLCGLSITNSTAATIDDCIRINDKCTEMKQSTDDAGKPLADVDGNPIMEKVVPTVSVSAKDGTVNTLRVTATGGNAIQCEAKLEFKGHGTLNMNTVSTSVDARAKVEIRNLTMNIESGNRGIDTKIETKNEAGLVIDTDYASIDFGANANVTINSTDDGIRCKNMEFEALDTTLGDVDSVVTVTSGGDAIQLEGKKGLTMYQGTVTLTGTKSVLNNKSGLLSVSGTAKLTDGNGNSLA